MHNAESGKEISARTGRALARALGLPAEELAPDPKEEAPLPSDKESPEQRRYNAQFCAALLRRHADLVRYLLDDGIQQDLQGVRKLDAATVELRGYYRHFLRDSVRKEATPQALEALDAAEAELKAASGAASNAFQERLDVERNPDVVRSLSEQRRAQEQEYQNVVPGFEETGS